MRVERAQDVVLGEDAGLLVRIAHENGADAAAHQGTQRSRQALAGIQERGRLAHHLAQAVAIGIAVDAHERARGLGGGAGGLAEEPAARLLLGEHTRGSLGLRERADVALAQQRQQRSEDAAGRLRVADRRMPGIDLDLQPVAEAVQAVVRERGGGELARMRTSSARGWRQTLPATSYSRLSTSMS